jgi:N-carbamoylputrescine amidase
VEVTVAATQMHCTWDLDANIRRAEAQINAAADQGAEIVLIQELFESPYFCIDEQARHFELARPAQGNPLLQRMQKLARERALVLPVSFFEQAGPAYFNSLAMIDADGRVLGVYRKSHIPHFPLYEEKFYFSPGDTGFRVFETRFGRIGTAVCWDQWFPEAARAMVLKGADLLFYPTAIGSELNDPGLDSKDHWQTVMRGHAAANVVPVVASNRIGTETSGEHSMEFYGSSFICDHTGRMVAKADPTTQCVLTHRFDLDEVRRYRRDWGVFRDRRPDLYGPLLTVDGVTAGSRS